LLGRPAHPIRALFFDKSPQRNWSLGWHQDRVVALDQRRDVPGYTNWTLKDGIPHAEPPFPLLEQSLTLRLHLDPVAATNAPLLIALGTHRLGRIGSCQAARLAEAHSTFPCLADAGDVWAYSTPILHRSELAEEPSQRRVIQILYTADAPPDGLQWFGI
jgi:hypothetical protein